MPLTELSAAMVFGMVLLLGSTGFAVLALQLGRRSAGRDDAPKGNAAVLKTFWGLSALLLVCGVMLLLLD